MTFRDITALKQPIDSEDTKGGKLPSHSPTRKFSPVTHLLPTRRTFQVCETRAVRHEKPSVQRPLADAEGSREAVASHSRNLIRGMEDFRRAR